MFGWVATNQLLVQSDRLITLLGGGCNQPIWKLLVKLDHSPGRHEITTYLPSNDIDSLRCRIAKEQWKLSSPGRNLTDFGYLKNQISSPSNLPTLRILWKVFFHLKMGWTNPQKSTFHIIPDHLKKTHPTKKNGVNGLCDFPHFSEASYPMDQKQSLFSMRRRGWRQMDTNGDSVDMTCFFLLKLRKNYN